MLPVLQVTFVPPSCVLNVCVYMPPLFVQFHCRESSPTVILKIIIKPQMSYECGVRHNPKNWISYVDD